MAESIMNAEKKLLEKKKLIAQLLAMRDDPAGQDKLIKDNLNAKIAQITELHIKRGEALREEHTESSELKNQEKKLLERKKLMKEIRKGDDKLAEQMLLQEAKKAASPQTSASQAGLALNKACQQRLITEAQRPKAGLVNSKLSIKIKEAGALIEHELRLTEKLTKEREATCFLQEYQVQPGKAEGLLQQCQVQCEAIDGVRAQLSDCTVELRKCRDRDAEMNTGSRRLADTYKTAEEEESTRKMLDKKRSELINSLIKLGATITLQTEGFGSAIKDISQELEASRATKLVPVEQKQEEAKINVPIDVKERVI